MPTRRSLLALAATAALCACTSPPALAVGSLVDLQIVDRARGDALPAYRFRGASYVAGRPGERYAVRLTNRSGARVLVVLSVDGVNAVSGETAATGQTGYVLAPWESAEITGWRKSASEAAAFYFTALPDSYAARTDRPGNVGVIGAAVFRERVVEAQRSFERSPQVARPRAESSAAEPERRAQAGAADSAALPMPASPAAAAREAPQMRQEKQLGTGHGEREFSPITHTAFERATSQPSEVVQLRYDSHANLLASGVIPRPRPVPRVPEPFPGYVPDPA